MPRGSKSKSGAKENKHTRIVNNEKRARKGGEHPAKRVTWFRGGLENREVVKGGRKPPRR